MSDDITTADVLRVYGKDAAVAYVNLCNKIDTLVAENADLRARAVWFDSEARQTEAIARAERDALAAEVSALRAALEAAETDAQLCRERLGDERERRRAAEALAVPEGWKVEWGQP